MMGDDNNGDGQNTTTTTNTVTYRAQPVVPMDIFTFQNLRMQPGFTPNSSKQINLYYWWGDHQTACPEHTQVTSAWVVGWVKSSKIRPMKVQDNSTEEPTYTLDLDIRDGTGQLKIIQLKTTLGANGRTTNFDESGNVLPRNSPFKENQYYSFILKPALQRQQPQQQEQLTTIQGYLVSYHEIANHNEITAHLSDFVKAYHRMQSNFPYFIHKVIRSYSNRDVAVSLDTLESHLKDIMSSEQNTSQQLVEYLNFLQEKQILTQTDSGYMFIKEQQ
ncbi:hypothetical protein RB653_008341 [Dictyostelium firmibasis]|uniref:Uncharacterized protein n=1 Tax=Dictyostelium firmibasis TaxID=79012 RepID=A0AAN7TZK4_9MYCE